MPTHLLARMTRRKELLTDLSGLESAVLFPSLGHLEADGQHWRVQVHGEIFSPGQTVGLGKRFLLKLLKRAMQADDADFEGPVFQQRIARFLATDCAGRQLAVRVDDDVHTLAKRSRKNGHFFGSIRVPFAVGTARALPSAAPVRLPLALCRASGQFPIAQGEAFLLPTTGVSVISDIDDTLKHSYVACKRTLLANTFLREFETIPGMVDVFQRWSQAGAAFHYVSSSPWQLYRHLADHLHSVGFPAGSYHLRAFRLRDHLIRRILMLRRSGKAAVIRGILKTFPQRQFVLVGDSGEADPEIYGAMARKFPRQVTGIFIRQIDGPTNSPPRYQRAFRSVPYNLVRLYRESAELGDVGLPIGS